MLAWRDLSDSANIPLIVVGVAIVLWLLCRAATQRRSSSSACSPRSTAGSEAVKELVATPRPPGFDNIVAGVVYSYPSGHVLEALTIYGMIAVLLWRSSAPTLDPHRRSRSCSRSSSPWSPSPASPSAPTIPSDVLAGLLGGHRAASAVFAVLTGDRRPTPRRESVLTSTMDDRR